MIGIYKVTNNINNKIYIGQSIDINKRWIRHKSHKTNTYFSSSIFKYGPDNFTWEIIELCKRGGTKQKRDVLDK